VLELHSTDASNYKLFRCIYFPFCERNGGFKFLWFFLWKHWEFEASFLRNTKWLIIITLKLHRSRCSGWLQAGREKDRTSSSYRGKNFHFSVSSRSAVRPTQLLIQWVPGRLFRGLKRPEHEPDHSAPTGTEVKKKCLYKFTTAYVFMPYCLIS
jgi:hypothetical protein